MESEDRKKLNIGSVGILRAGGPQDRTALMMAAQRGRADIMKLLLDEGLICWAKG